MRLYSATLLLLLLLLSSSAVVAQSGPKVISWSDHPQGSHHETSQPPLRILKELDIVEIAEVRVEGVPITLGQPFVASADWLNHITLRVKNLSLKPIHHLQITLTLPQLKRSPQIPYLVVGCPEKSACVGPGGEAELRIPALSLYEWVKSVIAEEKLELATVDRAAIAFVIATMEDGSQLSSGCVRTRDPKQACPVHVH